MSSQDPDTPCVSYGRCTFPAHFHMLGAIIGRMRDSAHEESHSDWHRVGATAELVGYLDLYERGIEHVLPEQLVSETSEEGPDVWIVKPGGVLLGIDIKGLEAETSFLTVRAQTQNKAADLGVDFYWFIQMDEGFARWWLFRRDQVDAWRRWDGGDRGVCYSLAIRSVVDASGRRVNWPEFPVERARPQA